jgi:hypothetical protein
MIRSPSTSTRWTGVLALTLVAALAIPALAQEPEAAGAAPAAGEAAAPAAAPRRTGSPYRKLAPWVMKEVDPERKAEETNSRHDVVELLAVDPGFQWAADVPFYQDVWALEFKFKPVRMIWIDVPQPNGQMRRQLIWYMVYSVTNTGNVMHPVPEEIQKHEGQDRGLNQPEKLAEIKYVDRPIRFIPEFVLEGHESADPQTGFSKAYQDRVIPVAMGPIRLREDRNRRFYSTVEICGDIAPGETKWGIVTWESLDPRIDRFSIYIKGLTNAYRWVDEKGAYTQGAPLGTGRKLYVKTLKLNFWRPGDEYFEHEREIRYGVPDFDAGNPEHVYYEWLYR